MSMRERFSTTATISIFVSASKASNRILRGANQSNERCDACMDSCWHQVESCEGREKVDCKVDLGFKR
jgi:hypothetical protein